MINHFESLANLLCPKEKAIEAHRRLSLKKSLVQKLGDANKPEREPSFSFTDEFCENFKCKPSARYSSKMEGRGSGFLSFRAWADCKKKWVAIFSTSGGKREKTIGIYPSMSIENARSVFDEIDREEGVSTRKDSSFSFTDEFCKTFRCRGANVSTKAERRGAACLVLRAYKGGMKSWVFHFGVWPFVDRETIGSYPSMSIEQARMKVDEMTKKRVWIGEKK